MKLQSVLEAGKKHNKLYLSESQIYTNESLNKHGEMGDNSDVKG